jgi:exodeoxyribonuclease (lambda-induced)
MADAMAVLKNGKEAEARKKLKIALVAERLTGFATENFVSPAMMWGIEQEPFAAERYEEITGTLIQKCGFALHETIPYFGASPDRLAGDDGLVEIKCPTTAVFVEWRVGNVVPPQHVPQMLVQLACTGRAWCDFFAFDPRVMAREYQHFLKRFEPPEEEIAAVEEAAKIFLAEVEVLFEQVTTGDAA